MATSQNGFPALPSDSPLLYTWTIPDTSRKLRLRNGSAGFLLIHLALWFDAKIEDVEGGILDDWGYAYRPVRGYETTLSNHSSGTAMDLNATKHVLGSENTFSGEEELRIRRRVNHFFDGTIRWGGEYAGRKDEMHFEIDASLKACEIVAKGLLDSPRGKRILAANKGQKAVILS
jgi:hypothetical protein